MKHATSRFLRFFLVAALVAAMAGSLMPTKVVGQAADSVVVTPSLLSTFAAAGTVSWTVEFELDTGQSLTAAVAAIPDDPDTEEDESGPRVAGTEIAVILDAAGGTPTMAHVTVAVGDGDPVALVDADSVTGSGDSTITIQSPVAAEAGNDITIAIAAAAGISHTTGAGGEQTARVSVAAATAVEDTYTTAALPLVETNTQNAGATARWRVQFQATSQIFEGNTEITVTFDKASVPSGISKNHITVQTPGATGTTAILEIEPTSGGKSISFFSPIAVADDAQAIIRISSRAGVAHSSAPGAATVSVAVDDDDAVKSDSFAVKRHLSISPSSAKSGATVTVTGGGFAGGTGGGIDIGEGDAKESGIGTYTVDASGVLTGSFVAGMRTSAGGRVSVENQGADDERVYSTAFSQLASATPGVDRMPGGEDLEITLADFGTNASYTVKVAGRTAAADEVSVSGNKLTLSIPQDEPKGTKLVRITGDDTEKSASFPLEIIGRDLTVTPSAAVPGQAVTVSGEGFNGITEVNLMLNNAIVPGGDELAVNNDGTFLYTGNVPFAGNAGKGSKEWKAVNADDSDGRSATSSSFSIQARAITLSPSTSNPGSTVEVFGSGWGVRTSDAGVTSQVTISLSNTDTTFGPFPVSSTGEFSGAFTVPTGSGTDPITVTATDNNGTGPNRTGGFAAVDTTATPPDYGDQTATATLRIPTGVVSVSPSTASTGAVITVTGTGFPAQTNLSELEFGTANALPVPAPATDVSGRFTVTLTVPAAPQGGSLAPGAVVITATVGKISGTTSFTIPGPTISLSTAEARPGESVTITGTNFSAFTTVGTVNIGQVNQAPQPNPLTDGTGNFSASVVVPTLNPGAYTVTVRAGKGFTATAPIRILSSTVGNVVPAEIAFQALTSRGYLTLAAAAPPGGTSFGAYVPGLAGNTLVQVEPNGVLILTLNTDARISVSGQPAVDVAANTPTFFAIGSVVSVEVVQ